MRLSLFAVMCCTALVHPAKAQAAVVAPFISGLTGGALFTVQGIAASIAGGAAGAAFTAGSAIGGTFLGRTLLGVGISALTAKRQPKFKAPEVPKASVTLANFAQPISYAEQKYGRSRVGGFIGFTGAKAKRRHYVPIFAAHEIDGVEQHWLDEYTVGVDASVTDESQPNLITSAEDSQYTAPGVIQSRGRISFFTGAPGQTASPYLVSNFSELDSGYDFAGLAGAYVWAKQATDLKVYPRGRQWQYTPVIRGDNNIYDPRDDTRKYTANAALVWAHWVTELLGRTVNWDKVAIEADASDPLVTTKYEGQIPKWEINGGLVDNQSFEAQRLQIMQACDGFMYEDTDGTVGLYVGRWIPPTVTVTEADCFQVSVSSARSGLPTEVSVIYIDQEGSWREKPSGVYVLEANAFPIREEVQAGMVIYHNQAARIAKRYGKSIRPEYSLSGAINHKGYELQGQRFFTLQHSALPGGSATFEITKLQRVNPMVFQIEAYQVEEGDFDFNAVAEEPDRPNRSDVVSDLTNAEPQGITAAAIGSNAIEVSWTAEDEFIWQEVRWKTAAQTEYQTAIVTDANEYIITGLVDGETYFIQVLNANAVTLSSPSDWAPDPALSVTVIANSTPPAALTAFTATPTGSDVLLEWTAPNDPNYDAVVLYRGTTTVFADAAAIHTEYASSGSTQYTDTGLAVGTYYYFADPINSSGIGGNTSGPLTVTIT